MKQAFISKRFSADHLALIDRMNGIIRRYASQGYDLTLRQLYYQLVAAAEIENSERSYKRIGCILNDARLAGMVDWDAIVDRGRVMRKNSHWESPGSIVESCAKQFQYDKWENQPCHVEVMVEKQALEGVLIPVCRRLDINFTANKGYSSSSAMYEAGKRMEDVLTSGRSVVVIYLGDHDPSGIDMTRDIEDRLRMFSGVVWPADDDGKLIESFQYDGSFTVERIALNMDQIEMHRPPPNPTKITDSRAKGYIDRFGHTSWELDALEPRMLSDLVEAAVLQYRDEDLWDAAEQREDDARMLLRDLAVEANKRMKELE